MINANATSRSSVSTSARPSPASSRQPLDVQPLLAALEQRLGYWLPAGHESDRVCSAMREGVLAPGKRVRPLLLLLVARDVDVGDAADPLGLLDFACAVEMIHAASLMLDDLPCMDDAALRRGRPTSHRQFGEDVTILAAVALVSRAFGVVAQAHGLPNACRTQAAASLSCAVGLQGLVQGQFRDLSDGKGARSAEAITTTNELKTSVLFDAALQMAALATGADAAARQALTRFARDLGQAFQLLDDLSDGAEGTGKDAHQDADKSTLIATLGACTVRKRLHAHLQSAERHLAKACPHGDDTRVFVRAFFDRQLARLS